MAGNPVDTSQLGSLLARLSPLDVKDLVFLLSRAQARDYLRQHLGEIRTGPELWTAVQNWYGAGAAALAALHSAMLTANMSLLARPLSRMAQLPPSPLLQTPAVPTQLRRLLFGVAVQFPVTDVPRLWTLLGLPASDGDAIDLMAELLCRGWVRDNGDGIECLQPLSQFSPAISGLCNDFAIATGRRLVGSVDGGGGGVAMQPAMLGAGAAGDVAQYALQNPLCVILNVRRVPDRAERLGSERDVQRLYELFRRFRYEVILSEEPTRLQYLALLQHVKFRLHGKDGLVFFVMSHGYKDHVILADGQSLNEMKHIVAEFQDGCMRGRPKIFFFQCCRGPKLQTDGPSAAEAILVPSNQDNADLCVCHSTFDGFASAREEETGSWFIQALCEQLDVQQRVDLDSLRMNVTAILQKKLGYVDGHMISQTSVLERCSLSKRLFLRPY